jgi:hypothetical protein
MKVYVTKYALTQGILEEEATLVGEARIKVSGDSSRGVFHAFYYKPDWYETREEAVARAEEMRKRKIASLEKSLKKFKNMKF